ncbi:hypothetical protein [Paracoccus sp. ME4]|uniref:hypothetical protein n=1 Tax=Paracoccus sp. ME4 TaxID=3138066 RepID=UPI00398BA2C2
MPLFCVLSILAGCAGQESHAPDHRRIDDRLIVARDFGGNIGLRFREIESLRAEGRKVEIRGTCASACTMYLALPDTCVAPQVEMRFHGPSVDGRPVKGPAFNTVSGIMARSYPEPLRSWFMAEGRYRVEGFDEIRGAELIAMGVPECTPDTYAKND